MKIRRKKKDFAARTPEYWENVNVCNRALNTYSTVVFRSPRIDSLTLLQNVGGGRFKPREHMRVVDWIIDLQRMFCEAIPGQRQRIRFLAHYAFNTLPAKKISKEERLVQYAYQQRLGKLLRERQL
jgi:hypothetical protein